MPIVLASRRTGNLNLSNLGQAIVSLARCCSFTMAVAVILFFTASDAHADTVTTFYLTTGYSPTNGTPQGEAFGRIKIDTLTGIIEAIDLSFTGEPSSGPLYPDADWGVSGSGPSAYVGIGEEWGGTDAFYEVSIDLPVNTLVGYTGGDICSLTNNCGDYFCPPNSRYCSGYTSGFQYYDSELFPYSYGDLSPYPTPEPEYLAFPGAGVLCLVEVFRRSSLRGLKRTATVSAH